MNPPLPPELIASAASGRRYLLLDGAQYQADPAGLSRHGMQVEALLDGEMAGIGRNVAPHLLEYTSNDLLAQMQQRILRDSASPHALSCLESPLEFAQLAARLRRRLLTRLPNGKKMLLRMQDARVLEPLASVLTGKQFDAFFGFCECCWYVDTSLNWSRIDATVPVHDPEDYCLQLDTAQRRALQDACYPHAVIAHFLDTEPALLDPVPPGERYACIRDALCAARQFGLEQSADAIVFCTLALVEGRAFHQQPDWQQWLAEVAQGRRTLSEVLDEHYMAKSEEA